MEEERKHEAEGEPNEIGGRSPPEQRSTHQPLPEAALEEQKQQEEDAKLEEEAMRVEIDFDGAHAVGGLSQLEAAICQRDPNARPQESLPAGSEQVSSQLQGGRSGAGNNSSLMKPKVGNHGVPPPPPKKSSHAQDAQTSDGFGVSVKEGARLRKLQQQQQTKDNRQCAAGEVPGDRETALRLQAQYEDEDDDRRRSDDVEHYGSEDEPQMI